MPVSRLIDDFITSITKERPYIVLKWAESQDGFIDRNRSPNESAERITDAWTQSLVHHWRSQEAGLFDWRQHLVERQATIDLFGPLKAGNHRLSFGQIVPVRSRCLLDGCIGPPTK